MTAQLLDYPTSATTRARSESRLVGLAVAPHRSIHRRPRGPVNRSWSQVLPAGGPAATAHVRAQALPSGQLYWTRRGLAVMVGLAAVLLMVLVGTLVAAFLAVSPAPEAIGLPAPVAAMAGVPGLG